MKPIKLLMALPLVLLAAGMAYADGVDSGFHLNGSDPPPAPTCGALLTSADSLGNVDASCMLGTTGTILALEILPGDVIGPLKCTSNLTNIGWTVGMTLGSTLDTCTVTAPTSVSSATLLFLMKIGDPLTKPNDGDCDFDDFVLGIPAGCTFTISTVAGAGVVPNSLVGFGVNGALPSLPEPASGLLLLAGLGIAVPFLRRKVTV